VARTEYWCDPAIAGDSGTGTEVDPYGDLQYALNQITRDATNGDIIHVKAGTAEVLAAKISLASYGALPGQDVGLAICGYATTAGDGDIETGTGMAEIDCNGFAFIGEGTTTGLHLINLKVHNCGANAAIRNSSASTVTECEIYDCDTAVFSGTDTAVYHCHIHDITGAQGVHLGTQATTLVVSTFFESGSLGQYWSNGGPLFGFNSRGCAVLDTIIYMASGHTSTASGVGSSSFSWNYTQGNSVFAENTPTGDGIFQNSVRNLGNDLNLIEGFDGTGAYAIQSGANTATSLYNAEFNCDNAFNTVVETITFEDETLSSTGFAKSGGISFANRLTYFENVDTGSVRAVTPHGVDKGAVQTAAPGASEVFVFDLLWAGMQDPYQVHRGRASETVQLPPVETHPPYAYSAFDAFELSSWDTSPSVEGAGPQLRAAAQGNQGQGKDKPSKPKPGKKFQPGKVWILGMEYPVPMSSPAMGPGGLPPVFGPESVFQSNMYWQDFHRDRPVIQPFEGDREPLFFGEQRMRVDWEAPLSIETRFRTPTLSDYQIEADIVRTEEITLDKWYMPLGYEFRTIPLTYPAMEVFVNLVTTEEPHVDGWGSPLTRPDPWRPKEPIQYWPFSTEDVIPAGEEIEMSKWYTRLSHPVWSLHQLRLPSGVLSEEPIPDEALLPTRIPWYVPMSHEFNRRTMRVTPPIGVLERGDDPEEATIDKWGTRLSEPVRVHNFAALQNPFKARWGAVIPKENITIDKWQSMPQPLPIVRQLPIALFPFREEGSPPQTEEITLDKWYQRMQDLTRFYRNAVTGPEGQDISLTVLTAPWIPLSTGSPEPIPDTPGVTYNYWLTAMSIPRMEGPLLPILYYPLQKFEFITLVPECDRPRRRPDRRKC
jgi:hypothetical protein